MLGKLVSLTFSAYFSILRANVRRGSEFVSSSSSTHNEALTFCPEASVSPLMHLCNCSIHAASFTSALVLQTPSMDEDTFVLQEN